MPYTITTKDGITVRNIPDDVPPDSLELKAKVEAIRRGEIKGTPTSAASRIPGAMPLTPPAQEPSLGDKLIGAGEAALTMATAIPAQAMGALAGLNELGGTVANAIADKVAGRPMTQSQPMNAGTDVMAAMTYQPRTQVGQEYAANVADAASQLIPLGALGGEMAAVSRSLQTARSGAPASTIARASAEGVARDLAGPAAAAGVSTAIDAGANAAGAARQAVTTLPRRALSALTRDEPKTPTPGTMGSAGAAATDLATQRVATAESLGLSGDAALTRGQATRDPAQLKFEVETSKMPDEGARLRARRVAQNEALLNEIERDIDITGAQAPSLRAVGEAVDRPLVAQYRADKTQVNRAYRAAEQSPESSALVDQTAKVTIGEGERALTNTPIDYINAQPTGLPNTAVVDAARQYAVKLGIAEMDNGALVPRPATISQLEKWRSSISQATGRDPSDIRNATILKGLIDGQTEPVAGPLYRQARNARARLAQNYEDRTIISKLLAKKPGTTDRAVALEDVFDHAILKGSLDDVRNVRRVMQRSGPEGAQGWKELQGQTLKHIRDEATKSVAADGAGNRVISPAAMDRTIRSLDHDGKLDFIFGKQGAQRLRDINDIAQVAKTVPPEAAVNFSNTAATMLTAFADLGLSGISGIPAPLATATRMGLKHVKDAKLRKRIDDALRVPNNTTQRN
jgi:hypothetical protein